MAGLNTILQARPQQNANDFLMFYLPEMLKNQMQLEQVKKQAEIYLRNQLAEYEAYGNIQDKQQKAAFIRETLGKLLTPDFYKERPMPELNMARTIQNYFPPELSQELGVTIPPAAEQDYASSILASRDALKARQTLDAIPADQLATLVRTIGYKPILETIQEIQKEKQARDEMALRGRELTETQKGNVLRGQEIGVRQEEVGLTKGGKKTAKELQTELDKKVNERQKYIDDYFGTGKSWQERAALAAEDPKNKTIRKVLTNQISDISDEIRGLKEKLGVQPDPKYKRAADTLKSQGLTPEDLLVNKPFRNQRTGETKGIRDLIIEDGYDIFKILEYMK